MGDLVPVTSDGPEATAVPPPKMLPMGMHAVGAQRREPVDSLDDFPTHPWATRALAEYVLDLKGQRVWECACNRGYMARPLAEYAAEVIATDVFDHGFGGLYDFLSVGDLLGAELPFDGVIDWVITNPPFNEIEAFLDRAVIVARRGVAFFGRLQLLESIGRYGAIWSPEAPHYGRTTFAPFVERVPLVKGRIDRTATTTTAYAWMVIDKRFPRAPLIHIPPCRAKLERDTDYPEAA